MTDLLAAHAAALRAIYAALALPPVADAHGETVTSETAEGETAEGGQSDAKG